MRLRHRSDHLLRIVPTPPVARTGFALEPLVGAHGLDAGHIRRTTSLQILVLETCTLMHGNGSYGS